MMQVQLSIFTQNLFLWQHTAHHHRSDLVLVDLVKVLLNANINAAHLDVA
jgi:hypothetical protein